MRKATLACLGHILIHGNTTTHELGVQGRSARVSAVSKAMDRLPSKKRSMREATLAWLESAARTREPEYLQLSSHTELLPILKAAQDPAVSLLLGSPKLPCNKCTHLCPACWPG